MLKCNLKKYFFVTLIFAVITLAVSLLLDNEEQAITVIILSCSIFYTIGCIHFIVFVIRLFYDGPSETNKFLNLLIFVAPFDKKIIVRLGFMFIFFGLIINLFGAFVL